LCSASHGKILGDDIRSSLGSDFYLSDNGRIIEDSTIIPGNRLIEAKLKIRGGAAEDFIELQKSISTPYFEKRAAFLH